jgi:hypothetical protein
VGVASLRIGATICKAYSASFTTTMIFSMM